MQTKISKPLLLLLLLGGVFVGGIIANQYNIVNFDNIFCSGNKFQYINKELACGGSFVVKKHSYGDLKSKINDFIQLKIAKNEINEIAIYFRDLKNGPTLGINEYTQFIPASLLKVPFLLTYLNLTETSQPELLEKKLIYHKSETTIKKQLIPPTESIKQNVSYTIDELLRHMIVYSDNDAYNVLLKYLIQISPDTNLVKETLLDLGIVDPKNFSDETITVKSYASVFLQLYNSVFFEKKDTSEKALTLIATADYHGGIEAGVPSSIKVAHKFGEREFEESQWKQFHDCGIVYYPDNPYLLCVMTRGWDMNKLQETISIISRMVYEEFNSRKI